MELVVNRVKQVKMLHVVMLLLLRFFFYIFELELLNAIQSSKFCYVCILLLKENQLPFQYSQNSAFPECISSLQTSRWVVESLLEV